MALCEESNRIRKCSFTVPRVYNTARGTFPLSRKRNAKLGEDPYSRRKAGVRLSFFFGTTELIFVNEIAQTFCELRLIRFWFCIASNCKVHTILTSVTNLPCLVLCWSRVQASSTSDPNFTSFIQLLQENVEIEDIHRPRPLPSVSVLINCSLFIHPVDDPK